MSVELHAHVKITERCSSLRLRHYGSHFQGQITGLVGCIRNPSLKGQPFGEPDRTFGVQACSDDVEMGTFFGADGGYTHLGESVLLDVC